MINKQKDFKNMLVKTQDGKGYRYKIEDLDIILKIIPHKSSKLNTILICYSDDGKWERILEKNKLDMSLVCKYKLDDHLNLILELSRYDLTSDNDSYPFKMTKTLSIDQDVELKDIEMLNQISIKLKNYKEFLDEFKKKLDEESREKELEDFIFDKKNFIPFFRIQRKQVSVQGYTETVRKIDITIQNFINVTSDILELKKSTFPVLIQDSGSGRFYWSQHTSQAISQVEEYISLTDENSNRKKTKYVHTKAIILIGRKHYISSQKTLNDEEEKEWDYKLESLNKSLQNISVITYDDFYALLLNFLKSFEGEEK